MIIDCHGHYTTAPAAHTAWRVEQLAAWERGEQPPAYPEISDDEIREHMSGNLCRCGAYTNIVDAIKDAIGRGLDPREAITQAVEAIRQDAERMA